MVVLFWNAAKKKNNNIILKMIESFDVDFVALAEYNDDVDELINELNGKDNLYRQYSNIGSEDITLIGKARNINQANQDKHYSIQIIEQKLIICCAHMPSRIYDQNNTRRKLIMQRMIKDLENTEEINGIFDSIVIGDLNANPYEDECLSADGLHGIPISEVSQRRKRKIEGYDYKMFYNPTWNLLGDYNSPPGTYYYDGSIPTNPYWHLLDQVLIRPSLNSRFVKESLRIIDRFADVVLVDDKGHPEKSISDHLPIIFEIKEEENGK